MVKFDNFQPLTNVVQPALAADPAPAPRKPGQSRKKVFCLTCGKPGMFTARGPNDVAAWLCTDYPSCDSYVGCEKGTENALGSPAGPEVRAARVKAHRWIDFLWRGKTAGPTRSEVYGLISQVMGMRKFHVAGADLPLLKRLDSRRLDIERAFGHIPESLRLTGDIVDRLDQSLLAALFGSETRRLWPADHGGQVAARRCLHVGTATSTVDAAGRRWLTKQKLPA